jgi:D-alanyl-D-alanine carboxypeptidase
VNRAIAILLLLTGCATTTAPNLPARIAAATNTPPFDRAIWSVLVVEDDGRVVHSQNAGELMVPASNRKLFAASTIVNCLGAGTRLTTELWRDGEDLVIRGGGDPSLGSWRYERDDDFLSAARQLRERGITTVRDVVIDVSLFDRVTVPGSWKVNYLAEPFGASVDAIAWNENAEAGRAVADPAAHAARAMIDALVLSGIDVTGAVRTNTEPRAWQEKILDIPSPFVGQLLMTVLKNSHNLYTEMLLKRSGGGTYDGALALERTFLTTEVHVDGTGFRFLDGSGLSPDDLVASSTTVPLLRWMNDPARRGFWWLVLAQPGHEGTLRRRLVELSDRVRGKTGTINGVAALSGIVAMPGGRDRYFSIMVNHHAADGDEAVKIIDGIVRMIAE